jgi:predicted nucleic acid-binding protein
VIVHHHVTNISYALDGEGLSRAVLGDQMMTGQLKYAYSANVPVLTSSVTLIEAYHSRVRKGPWNWTLSRVQIEPVTEDIANDAIRLLKETGLHGHKYAIDAGLAAIVRRQPGRVVVFTSDKDDMTRLCGKHAIIEPL